MAGWRRNLSLCFENVGKRGGNDDWNTVYVELLQPLSRKNWLHFCLLSAICCFADWKRLDWNCCVQNPKSEKSRQLFYCKHGHIWSAVSYFLDNLHQKSMFHLLMIVRQILSICFYLQNIWPDRFAWHVTDSRDWFRYSLCYQST